MTDEERANFDAAWDSAHDWQERQKKAESEEMAEKVGQAHTQMQEEMEAAQKPDGVSRWRTISASNLQEYKEHFNAQAVPYRWGMKGQAIESAVANPFLEREMGPRFCPNAPRKSTSSRSSSTSATRMAAARAELRAQQVDLDNEGGYWIAPIQMQNDIIAIADNMVYIRQWADVEPRVDAQSLGVPFREEDVEDADWTGEVTTVSETQIKTGLRALRPRNLTKLFRESFDVMMMKPSLSAYIVSRLGYKRGVTEERGFLLGNGVNEALGVFHQLAAGDRRPHRDVKSGVANGIALEGLQGCRWSLKGTYLRNAKWMGARPFWREASLVRGTDGHPIWHMATSMREPDRLLGLPGFVSEYVPDDITDGNYAAILGDWMMGYKIADAYDMTIQRVDQRWADENLIGYIMRSKTDGLPVLPEAFARLIVGA